MQCYGTLCRVKVLTYYVVSYKAVFSHLCYSQYIDSAIDNLAEILAMACTILFAAFCMQTTLKKE